MPRLSSRGVSAGVSLPQGHPSMAGAAAGPGINDSGAAKGWVGFQLGL